MALTTLISLSWSLFLRGKNIPNPPQVNVPITGVFNPYVVGFNVQLLIVPLVLIYIFSRTRIFQEAISGEIPPRRKWLLFGGFALLLVLSLSYELRLYNLSPDRLSLGLLVLITGSLLGGWQFGLGLGLLAMLILGTEIFNFQFGLFRVTPLILHDDGLIGFLEWVKEYSPHAYLTNLQASSTLWIGIFAGLAGEVLGKHRFTLLTVLFLGFFSDLWVNLLALIPEHVPLRLIAGAIPGALTSGVSLGAVALIIQGIQAEAAHKREILAQHALTRAELRALRAQINPHFLFNALNTIRYFVRTDSETARRLLLDLSEIFQHALQAGEFVRLEEEINYAKAYLTLEKARLGDRLEIHWNLPGDSSPWLDIPIPTLTLQPIVENAVVHGISPMPAGGTVEVSIRLSPGSLLIQVADTGVGIAPQKIEIILSPAIENNCVGLCNVDSRLRAIYGEESALKIESQPGEGTRVGITIPLRPNLQRAFSPHFAVKETDANLDRG